jgi:glycosyltransferase involved in cell wall biosynthesis
VLSALMFSPRGGSAHVARALAEEMPAHGWDVTLLSGSLGGGVGDAERFYAGLDVHTVDFAAGDAPMHPSYEDRPGAPDPVFATVDDAEYEAHVAAWAAALERVGARGFDVLHVHHLTPLNAAAARVAPGVPVVAHLHGTELLMLERIAEGAPPTWAHADAWARRMRAWAARAERVILLSASQLPRVEDLLGPEVAARCVVSPNGFDPATFAPRPVDRAAHWRTHLVTSPRGWRPGAGEGSVRYTEAETAALAEGPVLLSVGRFTAVKRMGLLVRAFARARRETAQRAALVLIGGHPGEWEDEHPWDAIRASGAPDVFLAGWHEHAALADFLNASDATVLASVREQFGLVLVEGMACGRPAIAVDRFGPGEIVEDGRTGWLVEPDDDAALAAALRDAIERPDERARRGALARTTALERWSWPALAERLATVLAEAAARPLAPR